MTQRTLHRSLSKRGTAVFAACIIAIIPPHTAGFASAQSASAVRSAGELSRASSVAVVPFANVSANPADDWIGFGIAETVTVDLARFALSIVGREAFVGLGRTSDLASGDAAARAQARELGASWIVTGGFQRIGEQLRITARLVNVETGATRQSVKIDGAMGDVFALQDRIVSSLAESLQQIAPGSLGERSAPVSPRPAVPARAGTLRVPTSRAPNVAEAPVRDRPDERPVRRAPSPSEPASIEPAVVARDSVTGGIVIGDNAPRLGVAAEAGALTGRPSVRPVRARSAPAIDGRLDDAVWRDAARIVEFVQRQPLDGAPATEATEVYIAYDSSNLYFGFYAHYSNPAIIRANRSDRDGAFRDDVFSVYFDTFLDQQRAYVFSVNGFGVQGDSILNSQGAAARAVRAAGVEVDVVVVAAAVADRAAASARSRVGTPRGTRCSRPPASSWRMGSRPRWRFPTRASAIRSGAETHRISGASRSSASSAERTRPSSGPPPREPLPASCRRWVCSTA